MRSSVPNWSVPPTQDFFERAIRVLRSTVYANAGFGPAVMTQWIEDGSAQSIAAGMVAEVTARWRLASAVLQARDAANFPWRRMCGCACPNWTPSVPPGGRYAPA